MSLIGAEKREGRGVSANRTNQTELFCCVQKEREREREREKERLFRTTDRCVM